MKKQQAFPNEAVERFNNSVTKTDSCWLWGAGKSKAGYGVFWFNKRLHYAHRIAFEMNFCPIDSGMVIDHICRNRQCVNPSHLRQVSRRINAVENNSGLPAIRASMTHCLRGHIFSQENTIMQTRKGRTHKTRVCRTCYEAKKARQKVSAMLAEDAEFEAKANPAAQDPIR